MCAFRLKEVPTRLCSNKNSDPILEEKENENSKESSDTYEQGIKSKILQSSLPYVPQHGWSRDTIAAGINF